MTVSLVCGLVALVLFVALAVAVPVLRLMVAAASKPRCPCNGQGDCFICDEAN